ncbi:hypothetical protein ONS96_013115 [Cadophora gregata f. sp. sojae]|nr:hypothetical protein ONS96_013115 [Cadophora gregata f. sp. sojae]
MSLEDLYKDLAISKEEGALNTTPLPAFNFPELPEAITTAHDKANWKTLGEILNKCNGHVATLDGIVNDLVSASENFRYIGDSVRWMKTELERMCEMPPLAAEESETSSESEEESEEEIKPVNDDNSSTLSNDNAASDASSVESRASETERMFCPSEMYDWSEIEEDVHMLQDIIIMNPLMAIYEILDMKTTSESDFDDLFAQPIIANWDGEMVETLLEALGFLAQLLLKTFEPNIARPPVSVERVGGTRQESTGTESARPYPSPKMTDAHEIRILELLPGLKDEPIQGLLTIEHLWDDPRYEALSYAWGTSTTTRPIKLNKTEFDITPNLETALLHLRDEKESRRLWIDALCINQSDPVEKQAQVKLMSDIYPAAENVLCWLGPEADDSDLVFQRLQELAEFKKASGSDSDDENDSDSDEQSDAEVWFEKQSFLSALFKLLSRAWWSRLWTCQEFALTLRDPQIICGEKTMPWSLFRLAARQQALRMANPMMLQGKTGMTELDPTTFWETYEILYGFLAACILRNSSGFAGLPRTSLFHPLYAMTILTRRYRCLDSRDNLFGLLSFLLEPHRALLPPNYLQPAETVNTKFSAAALAVSRSGRLYSYLSVGSHSCGKLPSWVFDLSSRIVDGEFNPSTMLMPRGKDHFFSASKRRKAQCIPLGPRLMIRGVLVDLIESVSNVNDGQAVNPASMYSNLIKFRALAARKSVMDIPPGHPVFKFKNLRAADPITDVTTCGMCSEEDFHSAFRRWIPSGKADGVPPNAAESQKNPPSSSSSSAPSSSSVESKETEENIQLILYSIVGRKLLITRSGFFGIGVKEIRAGDILVVLFGFDVPMVLRDCGGYFSMVGAARVGGIMEGKLMEFVEDGTLQERTFLIR